MPKHPLGFFLYLAAAIAFVWIFNIYINSHKTLDECQNTGAVSYLFGGRAAGYLYSAYSYDVSDNRVYYIELSYLAQKGDTVCLDEFFEDR